MTDQEPTQNDVGDDRRTDCKSAENEGACREVLASLYYCEYYRDGSEWRLINGTTQSGYYCPDHPARPPKSGYDYLCCEPSPQNSSEAAKESREEAADVVGWAVYEWVESARSFCFREGRRGSDSDIYFPHDPFEYEDHDHEADHEHTRSMFRELRDKIRAIMRWEPSIKSMSVKFEITEAGSGGQKHFKPLISECRRSAEPTEPETIDESEG